MVLQFSNPGVFFFLSWPFKGDTGFFLLIYELLCGSLALFLGMYTFGMTDWQSDARLTPEFFGV